MITVIADDLTGACEIAGVAFEAGLSSAVRLPSYRQQSSDSHAMLATGSEPTPVEVQVIDTETRLAKPAEAAQAIEQLGGKLVLGDTRHVFKKTDSVLRGQIRAELEALTSALGTGRVLLVPGNHKLGRHVVDGVYWVQGRRLSETVFAIDPHHPAKSSDVREILRGDGRLSVYSAKHDAPLPEAGLIVGDASTAEDLARWAQRAHADGILAGGSSSFFEAWLRVLQPRRSPPPAAPEIPGPTLLISGTTVEPQRALARSSSDRCLIDVQNLKAVSTYSAQALQQLRTSGRAVAYVEGGILPDPSASDQICATFAELGFNAVRNAAARHLVIEGGATAAAVARRLSWSELRVLRVWAPGVVSLAPTRAPNQVLTVKPGSYPWPETLAAVLFGSSSR
jgi:D-threonate/D-erythronate kinase